MDRSQQIKSQVIGFLIPIFIERDLRTGEVILNGLDQEGFDKVVAGYACGNCLAEFDTYTITCPACGEQRDTSEDLPKTPELWLDAMRDRETPPPPTRRIEDVSKLIYGRAQQDDQVKLDSLKPTRRGARRS